MFYLLNFIIFLVPYHRKPKGTIVLGSVGLSHSNFKLSGFFWDVL